MSTSAAQAIPSLVSLVAHAGNVLHHPLEFNAQLPCVTEYFDEAAKVKSFIKLYYPSALEELFFKEFETVVNGCISQFNFRKTWETMLQIESDCIKASISGRYSISGNQIVDALTTLPPLRIQVDDDIQMSSAPFTPVLTTSKEVQTMPMSSDAMSASASKDPELEIQEETPLRDTGAMSPSTVSSADWVTSATVTLSVPTARALLVIWLIDVLLNPLRLFVLVDLVGIPDRQILLMPFKDPHPEDDDHILDIIDELIDADPYGSKPPAGIPDDPHTEAIVKNAKGYVGANFQQFSPHGPESVGSLVKTQEAYLHKLETNTHKLYLGLKTCHILVQHYHLVTVKLDEARTQEEAEANTAAKMRNHNHASSSSHNNNGHWWRRKHQCNSRGHGKKNRAQDKGRGKRDDCKGKGKNEAVQYIKECIGWGCDHDNCNSNQETQDDVQGVCDCRGWGSCGHPACPLRQGGSWGQTDSNVNQYQDNGNGYGNYSSGGGKASGSKASGSKHGRRYY
ncbi:uncharacterized protein ARMOST_09948 [Armillaria ostoyae]|uniref:Uncharacterized protein n=1 Tax=Armillaria ostoyae TaxID=47428 RepID=A0A284RCX7_ARMOS|nr:uncharacterized protein ARMOST_09948 [Armillaria ostoyae]